MLTLKQLQGEEGKILTTDGNVNIKWKDSLQELQEKGEEEFKENFGYLLGPIKVTPYYGEDIKKAKLLQDMYSKIGTNILDFLHQQTTLAYNAGKADMLDTVLKAYKEAEKEIGETRETSFVLGRIYKLLDNK